MHKKFGYARVVVISPEVVVGDPSANYRNICAALKDSDADVVVFPELCVTGYTCGDLFKQNHLLQAAEGVVSLLSTVAKKKLVFVGAPVRQNGILYNCAIVLHEGHIIGIVPKQFIPTYNEFYERRWFAPATGNEPKTVIYGGQEVPFGIDLLFREKNNPDFVVGAEICEDLWMPIPPSSFLALAGATLLVNLSASNETVAKCEYRSELIRNQSGRCLAAYAYASAGPTESTTDLVFSGHCIIVENGNDLAESSHIGDGYFSKQDKTVRIEPVRTAIADIDFQKLAYERQVQTSFADQRHLLTRQYRTIDWLGDSGAGAEGVFNMRRVNGFPFVPTDPAKLEERCAAIFDIQCAGLVKRLQSAGIKEVTIGVSGGLDSTLALLVAHKAFTILGLPTENIKAFTMPGFGTTAKTINIAKTLMENLGVTAKEIDIAPVCTQMFMDMGHKPFGIDITDIVSEAGLEDGIGYFIEKIKELPPEKRHDLIFENTQARVRTNYLMNQGFVIGTGDLSEAALGWCTYNGDHMSMYNVNCSIPKTLVRFLVKYVAEHQYEGAVRDVLLECVGMTISPELLPPDKDGKIAQSTEDSIGPYALHDFFLWNFIRCGYSPEKILFLAADTDFTDPVTGAKNDFDLQKIKATLDIFIKRFFSNQFKRDCVPGGPKVGSVSLSPRGDWRMPADASSHIWMRNEK